MTWRSRPVPIPQTAQDYIDRRTCIACQRAGTVVEFRVVPGHGEAWLCIDTGDCIKNWEPADA